MGQSHLLPLSAENGDGLPCCVSSIKSRCPPFRLLITSQLPAEAWHDYLGDPTVADAILDRLIHNAYRITQKGGPMRKRRSQLDPIGHLA